MKFVVALVCAVCLVSAVSAKIYFHDSFDDGSLDKWVVSKAKGSDAGKFEVAQGKFFDEESRANGMRTSQDAKFYQISAKLDSTFDNKDKDLVLQFIVKHEQNIDCGGGYVKLLPGPLDQSNFDGDSDYHIMFGPDICGASNRKVHSIINYKGENHLIKQEVPLSPDEFSHVYTFILHPDQTFEVLIDGEEKRSGSLIDEWDVLPPRKIKDPAQSKPKDWVDDAEMDDPEDEKPEGWDDIPETIADPDAEIPSDWDEELDGEWEAPVIDNPEYKGEWAPRRIPNPDYKGPWVHPEIDNPDFKEDSSIYHYVSDYIGIEVWQVKAGTLFDDFLVTDDVEEAEKWRKFALESRDAEKDAKAAADKEARAAAEAARAEADEAEDDLEDEDDWEEDEDEVDSHVHDEL